MNHQQAKFGELTCAVVDNLGDASPECVVVLCHGFGAPGDDLVPLGGELLRMDSRLAGRTRFVFPTAPLSLDSRGMYGGRAWWHLDLEARLQAIERGDLRILRQEDPDGMQAAVEMLTATVREVQSTYGIPSSKLLIGGFSQGAMVTTDVALHLEEAPAGLCIMSGTFLREDKWTAAAKQRGPLRVLQSHGREDPILPFVAAEWLRDLLTESGCEVEFLPFTGEHTIPYEMLTALAGFIAHVIET